MIRFASTGAENWSNLFDGKSRVGVLEVAKTLRKKLFPAVLELLTVIIDEVIQRRLLREYSAACSRGLRQEGYADWAATAMQHCNAVPNRGAEAEKVKEIVPTTIAMIKLGREGKTIFALGDNPSSAMN